MDVKSSIKKIIEEEIINNLCIRVTSDYNGYVAVRLLYKGKVIDEDTTYVITNSNPLDK